MYRLVTFVVVAFVSFVLSMPTSPAHAVTCDKKCRQREWFAQKGAAVLNQCYWFQWPDCAFCWPPVGGGCETINPPSDLAPEGSKCKTTNSAQFVKIAPGTACNERCTAPALGIAEANPFTPGGEWEELGKIQVCPLFPS